MSLLDWMLDWIPWDTWVGWFRKIRRKVFGGDRRRKDLLTNEQLAAYERDRNRRPNS